jgi:hypothetical protein
LRRKIQLRSPFKSLQGSGKKKYAFIIAPLFLKILFFYSTSGRPFLSTVKMGCENYLNPPVVHSYHEGLLTEAADVTLTRERKARSIGEGDASLKNGANKRPG